MKDRFTPLKGWRGARLAGIAAAIVSTAVVATGAGAAPGGEKGKPEAKPPPPGQEKQAQPDPEPQAQAEPEPQAKSAPPPPKAKGEPQKPKSSKPAKQAPAKSQAPTTAPRAHGKSGGSSKSKSSGPKATRDAGTGDNPQGRGPSGKTQYCHATHSETNPFVLITTNNNALPAHRAHQDEEDIIPAVNGQCPGGTTAERPIDEGGPGPGGPDAPGPDEGQSGGPGGPNGDDGPGLNGVEGAEGPGDGAADAPSDRTPGDGDVLAVRETNAVGTGPAADVAEEADEGDALPFTGLGVGAILAIALLALAGGLAVRRVGDRTGA